MKKLRRAVYNIYMTGLQVLYKPTALIKSAKYSKTCNDLKIEIGSGPKRGSNGWVTIDLTPKADILWNLSKGLPFGDNTVSYIYSSHVMEHFTFDELNILINECYRVLKPEGVFSACVPNARLYIESYINREKLPEGYMDYKPAVASDLPMDRINYIAYMDGHHKYMFDEENLQHLLTSHSFREVGMRDFDPELDLADRKNNSLFVKGIK